jgi:hypothetical protein
MATPDKGVSDIPRQDGRDGARLDHTTQLSIQLKTYGLSISGIFHAVFSG